MIRGAAIRLGMAWNAMKSKATRYLYELDGVDYGTICKNGLVDRPHYGYCVYHAGYLAERLSIERVSLLEFGVSGGRGLVNLESHAERVEDELNVTFEVHGFDTGEGMPAPRDYRDLPYNWQEGQHEMDRELLTGKLDRSQLHIGDVAETIPKFIEDGGHSPIGAIFVDLDYYSSTRDSFQIFDAPDKMILPRVITYFDDVCLGMKHQYIPDIGELKAIEEFNVEQDNAHIGKIQFTTNDKTNRYITPERIYSYHRFDHEKYNDYVGKESKQRPIQ